MSKSYLEVSFEQQDPLMKHAWPPVDHSHTVPRALTAFLAMKNSDRTAFLIDLRSRPDDQARFIQNALSSIYGFWLGYEDSPLYLSTDDSYETDILAAKILIEREMLDHWLKPAIPPCIYNQQDAIDYLRTYIAKNTGIYHDFLEYVRADMPYDQMIEFLQFETVRNEVVDDEVAMIVIGLQGQMKSAMVSNLWDECGNGDITGFHTHWLRRLLTALGGIEAFCAKRQVSVPWFTGITSNSFNMMATRPGYKFRAYGSFLITESWVNAHFTRVLEGMERLGLEDENLRVYFDKHCTIDPHHTDQILSAMAHQQPSLTEAEIAEVLWGAHTAVAAGTKLYEESLKYFVGQSSN